MNPKIKHCPVCTGPLLPDQEGDDWDENENYHDRVGHNYRCKKHGNFVIFAKGD